jgi:hypothetical protein
LPIAVEVIVAIVIAAAAIATIRNPEHALDGAHRAADAGADRAAHHAAHRAGDPVAFPGALLGAAHDALRMPDLGDSEQCENDGRNCKIELHGQTGWQRRCRGLHLNSFWRPQQAGRARESVTPMRPKGCAAVGNSGRASPALSAKKCATCQIQPSLRLVCARLRINDAPNRPLEPKPNSGHIAAGDRASDAAVKA